MYSCQDFCQNPNSSKIEFDQNDFDQNDQKRRTETFEAYPTPLLHKHYVIFFNYKSLSYYASFMGLICVILVKVILVKFDF